jgi:ribosome recycling factor
MVEEKAEEPSKFINAVDKQLRESILRLDQKLKGMQAEVQVKLESIANTTDNQERERERVFSLLADELAQAIDSIKNLVNMVVSDEVTDKEFLKSNQENIEKLRDLFASNLDTISKLKEQF